PRRLGGLLPVPVLGLQLRRQTYAIPFLFVEFTVAVAVEAPQQPGVVPLPLTDHLALSSVPVEPLLRRAQGTTVANGIEWLANVKALFAVAITLTTGEKAEQAGLGRAQRVAQIALPHLAHCSLDLGTPRVDQALTGTIDEAQPGVTGATLDHPPAALL